MNKQRAIALSVVALIIMAVLGWKGYGWWLKHKLERYKAELAAQGERLTLNELLEGQTHPENNSVGVFREARGYFYRNGVLGSNPPSAMLMVAPGRAMTGWKQPCLVDSWNDPSITNTWDELAKELTDSRAGIELLHQLIEHPEMDYGLDYAQGFNLLLPHLAPLKSSAQTLSAAALFEMHQGNAAAAVPHIRAMLALCKGATDEQLLISQLVRIAIANITLNVTWEWLQSPALSEEELRLVQADWEQLDFVEPMRRAIEMERAMSGMSIRYFRENGGIFDMFGPTPGPAPITTTEKVLETAKQFLSPAQIRKNSNEVLWQSALSYEDELIALQGLQVLVEASRTMETNRCFAPALSNAEARLEKITPSNSDAYDDLWLGGDNEYSLASVRDMVRSVTALFKALKKVQQAEVIRVLAMTAIALKRYELSEGSFPDSLEALVPGFLSAVPIDPVDGQPLHYRLGVDGTFLLYSIGENGVDDGGDASNLNTNSVSRPNFIRSRDWVWPQPATPEEIRIWQEDQLKRDNALKDPGAPVQP